MTEDLPGGESPGDRPHASRGRLNEQSQQRIGNHLRALYDSVVQQPIPDRFRDLIAHLDDNARPSDPSDEF